MDKKRIFIGIPCYKGVSPETLEDYMALMYHCGRRLPQYDIYTGIISKSEQFRARNAMVTGAIQVQADYLLMLDDDMILSPYRTAEAYDFIDTLVKHNKDIVGALYFQRMGNYMPVAMVKSGERGYRFLREDELDGGLQRVDVVGGGAMLVRMKVFDRLPQPYFAPEHEFGTDVQLCRAAADKGFEIWLDSSIELGHVKEDRIVITSRNRARFAMETNTPDEVKHQMVTGGFADSVLADIIEWTGFKDMNTLSIAGQTFMTDESRDQFLAQGKTDAEWYAQFPKERVARQCWFNLSSPYKKQMTETILATVGDQIKANILDFGCGIGIPAFEFAKRGHRVTACDIRNTGTFKFLQWRVKKHGVPMTFHDSTGGVPHLGGTKYAAVVAMDVLEHIPEWRTVLFELASRIEPGGVLFCNNGILDDNVHPEHYPLDNKEFIAECLKNNLFPIGPITFIKREAKTS